MGLISPLEDGKNSRCNQHERGNNPEEKNDPTPKRQPSHHFTGPNRAESMDNLFR
jgi:hypothetical protein